jgi:hypothetical protein
MRNDYAEVSEQASRLAGKRRTLAGRRLAGGALPGIGLAGPMGAGKDTTAAAIADVLRHPSVAHVAGGRAARRVAFADVLKREAYRQALAVKTVLTLRSGVESALDVERAIVEDAALCAAFMPVGAPLPGGLVGLYCQIVADAEREGDTGAWDEGAFIAVKTPAKRVAYQLLGQAVRSVDSGYWVRAAVNGVDWEREFPIFTDVRMPNEVAALYDAGAPVVCLRVSPEVQRERLMGRDGSLPSVEALRHETETALDEAVRCGAVPVVDASHGSAHRVALRVLKTASAL